MNNTDIQWSLHDSWGDISELVLYGFGRVAKANIDYLRGDFEIRCIIDNGVSDGEINGYQGIRIVNRKTYLQQYKKPDDRIVITATGRALDSIQKDLTESGLRLGIDFTDIKSLLGEWYLRYRHQLNIGRVAHSVTQLCTFRCRDCQLLMPYIDCPKHDPVELLKSDLDLLFAFVDHVSDLDIMGGETFLYPQLLEYIGYLVVRYRNKTGNLQIVTNGSVIPSDEILSFIRDAGIHVRISDYTNVIPYQNRLEQFIARLDHEGIPYFRFREMEWSPFGYPYKTIVTGNAPRDLRDHIRRCGGGMSHSLHRGRLYYCNTAGGACENADYELPETDYIDLVRMKSDPDGKIKLWAYCMGLMENGGMQLCRYCNGYDSEESIPAGIQL